MAIPVDEKVRPFEMAHVNFHTPRLEAMKAWYLSVVNEMARALSVQTVAITGLWWGEIDSPQDLASVRSALEGRRAPERPTLAPLRRAGGFAG